VWVPRNEACYQNFDLVGESEDLTYGELWVATRWDGQNNFLHSVHIYQRPQEGCDRLRINLTLTFFCRPSYIDLSVFVVSTTKRSFATITETEIEFVMERLNNRPRKCLGFKSPNKAFFNHSIVVTFGSCIQVGKLIKLCN